MITVFDLRNNSVLPPLMGQREVQLFGTRRADRPLKCLEFLYLVLRLRGLPLLAIQAGQPKMRLRGKRGIFLKFNYLQPCPFGGSIVTNQRGRFAQ
jgi:hypothetical protein